jgi:hypothetical protein
MVNEIKQVDFCTLDLCIKKTVQSNVELGGTNDDRRYKSSNLTFSPFLPLISIYETLIL